MLGQDGQPVLSYVDSMANFIRSWWFELALWVVAMGGLSSQVGLHQHIFSFSVFSV